MPESCNCVWWVLSVNTSWYSLAGRNICIIFSFLLQLPSIFSYLSRISTLNRIPLNLIAFLPKPKAVILNLLSFSHLYYLIGNNVWKFLLPTQQETVGSSQACCLERICFGISKRTCTVGTF